MNRQRGQLWGLLVSPVVANLCMEDFEHRALTSSVSPPRLWKRFVDDTFVILLQSQKEDFLQHINSVDPSIKFTTEEPKEDGFHAIPGHISNTKIGWNLDNMCV